MQVSLTHRGRTQSLPKINQMVLDTLETHQFVTVSWIQQDLKVKPKNILYFIFLSTDHMKIEKKTVSLP